jgi:hypothetical protein
MTSFTSLLQTGFPFVADLFSNFVLGYDGGLEGRKIVHVNGGFVWVEMRAPPSDLKAPMLRSVDSRCSFRRMMMAGGAPHASASSPSKSTKGGKRLNNRSPFVMSSVTSMDAGISLRRASVRGSKRVPLASVVWPYRQ